MQDTREKELLSVLEEWKNTAESREEGCRDNEAQTRKSLVDPFLRQLGWNDEDTGHVRHEYPVDKSKENRRQGRGETVDYALFRDESPDKPWLFIEAKHAGVPAPQAEVPSQLSRYAQTHPIHYACWTNGINWIWYKKNDKQGQQYDLEKFLSHNVTNPQKSEMRSLLAMSRCIELETTKQINRIVEEESMLRLFEAWFVEMKKSPSDAFLKFIREQLSLPRYKEIKLKDTLDILKNAWLKRMIGDTDENPCSKSEPELQHMTGLKTSEGALDKENRQTKRKIKVKSWRWKREDLDRWNEFKTGKAIIRNIVELSTRSKESVPEKYDRPMSSEAMKKWIKKALEMLPGSEAQFQSQDDEWQNI